MDDSICQDSNNKQGHVAGIKVTKRRAACHLLKACVLLIHAHMVVWGASKTSWGPAQLAALASLASGVKSSGHDHNGELATYWLVVV
jgi:hypothetical protein